MPCLPEQMFKGDIDRPSAYEGPRDEAGIIKYLKKQVRTGGLAAVNAPSALPMWPALVTPKTACT